MRDHIGELQKINVSSWTEELKGVNSRGGWVGLQSEEIFEEIFCFTGRRDYNQGRGRGRRGV